MEKVNKLKTLSIQKNFIFNLAYQILNLLLPLITTPYISRTLGAENIGIYSYTYAIVSTFVMVGSLGIATYGQKEIASYRDNQNKSNTLFWEIFLIRIVTISISILVYLIYIFTNREYFIYFLVQIIFLISASIDISWYFQGIERFDFIVIRNLCIKVSGIMLIFILVKDSSDLITYLSILAGSQLLGNLSAWFYLRKFIGRPKVKKDNIKHHFRETLVFFVPTIAYQIYAVLDRVMLGTLAGSSLQNGYYEQAYKIVGILVSIYTAYNIVLRSRMSFYFKNKKHSLIKETFNFSLKVIIFFSVSMSIGLFCIAEGFVPWFFGNGYEEVIILLKLFAPIIFVMGLSMCIGTHILTPCGLQKKANIAQCVAAVVNLLLNYFLIPKYLARGATIASFFSQLSVLIIYIFLVYKYIDLKSTLLSLFKNILAGVVMFIVISNISIGLNSSVINTAYEVISGSIIYILVLVILKDYLSIHSIKWIIAKFKKGKNYDNRTYKNLH
ncbi:flippase [Intestinibacter sp.]|uniref:flippase n=1 Tax=Intestinibacter sp. TaxID=1965304 RepID=UPI00307E6B86